MRSVSKLFCTVRRANSDGQPLIHRQSPGHANLSIGFCQVFIGLCQVFLGILVTALSETQQRRRLRKKDRAFDALEALRRTAAGGAALDGYHIRRHACRCVLELGCRDHGAAKSWR
jgi:hypothetical protein